MPLEWTGRHQYFLCYHKLLACHSGAALARSFNNSIISPEIGIPSPGDQVFWESVGAGAFDRALCPYVGTEFLGDLRHHLAVAIDAGRVDGFASGVHDVHPDRPAELWMNAVGMAERHQECGLGKAIRRVLLLNARVLGCQEARVFTDWSNVPAGRLYTSTGKREAQSQRVMWSFSLAPWTATIRTNGPANCEHCLQRSVPVLGSAPHHRPPVVSRSARDGSCGRSCPAPRSRRGRPR